MKNLATVAISVPGPDVVGHALDTVPGANTYYFGECEPFDSKTLLRLSRIRTWCGQGGGTGAFPTAFFTSAVLVTVGGTCRVLEGDLGV